VTSAILAFVGVFLFIAGLNSLKPVDTTEYLQLHCAQGSDLNLKTVRCEKPGTTGALIRITVNRMSGAVLIDIVENNNQFIGPPWFFLDRCHVADFSEWRCGNTSITDKIDLEYGVHNGRFFQSVTGGTSPNFYTAGIQGWTAEKL
jgi:hypothetical protein